MCGIAGYVGKKNASVLLLKALRRLEYRGYDSVGMTIVSDQLETRKGAGKVEAVNDQLHFATMQGNWGIAHTRWSTHGKPSDANAHPFTDTTNSFALIHNGIIENYLELKEELRAKGIKFSSDTDSEVLVHLIAQQYSGNLKEAVLAIIKRLQGAYAFCVLHKATKEIIGARNGSPLVVGIGKGENFLASDVSALIEHTRSVVYLDDFQIASITPETVTCYDFDGKPIAYSVREVKWDIEQAQKGGYKHFMLKEIFEQPVVVEDSLNIKIPFIEASALHALHIVACGTAWHAGIVGKYLIEQHARIPVSVDVASEFRYRNPILTKKDVVIVISQSGETADTLAALRLAKKQGAKTIGIINVVDSTIAREADQVIYTRAGSEIGVASTKAFISQLVVLFLIAQLIAKKPLIGLAQLPKLIRKVLAQHEAIKRIAEKYFSVHNFLFIGRNIQYPIAMEGALKLKEISYIHAEAYAGGELKHGPIALITDATPTIALAVKDEVYQKMVSNIQEIRARSGKLIAIATEGDREIAAHAEDVFFVPQTTPLLYPLLTTIPLQLLAYFIADLRECDIDKPRNLAKSVTVE